MIIHVDMDSFFSSIEVRGNPELKGKPVVVGADPKKGRGVVSTCSYEARKYGIKSGMPISKAYRLNPHAIFLPVNINLYRKVSGNIMKIIRSYGDKFQQVSIDEAYLDVSNRAKSYHDAKVLAEKIKKEIMQTERLTCSIGIGPNKLIAKIASGIEKPDGLTVVRPSEVTEFLSPLPVGKIPGIGPKTEAMLKEMGIETIGELAKTDVQKLREAFGKWGCEMHQFALGIDKREVKEKIEAKSIGRERTFDKDTANLEKINKTLIALAHRVQEKIVKKGYLFKTITLKVRLKDFTTYTRSRTLEHYTNNLETLIKIAQGLLNEFVGNKIRLIGVRVSGIKLCQKQKSLAEF